MKKSLIAVAVAAVFAACNSNPKTGEQTNIKGTDTAGLAQFQMWKQQQSVKEQLGVIETNGVNDRLNNANNYATSEPLNEPDNVNATPQEEKAAKPTVIYRDRPTVVYKDKPARTSRSVAKTSGSGTSHSGGSGKVSQPGGGSGTASHPTVSTTPAKKKGWSKAAKGTAIGAGSGAVLGAVLSKNKVKGAVIGGIIGAGGGYAIGRSKDKKDGRY